MDLIINLKFIIQNNQSGKYQYQYAQNGENTAKKDVNGNSDTASKSGKRKFCSQIWEVQILRVQKGSTVHHVMKWDYM